MSDTTVRGMSVSAAVHVTPDARYDVHQQSVTGAYVVSIEAAVGTSGVDLFFRTLAEFDRFVEAVNEGQRAQTVR